MLVRLTDSTAVLLSGRDAWFAKYESLMPSLGEWPLVSFLDQSRRYGNETNAQVVEVIRSPGSLFPETKAREVLQKRTP